MSFTETRKRLQRLGLEPETTTTTGGTTVEETIEAIKLTIGFNASNVTLTVWQDGKETAAVKFETADGAVRAGSAFLNAYLPLPN